MKSRLLNKFLNGWKLQDHYVKKLLEQKDSPFKMKNEADSIKSSCLIEIQNNITPLWLSIKNIAYKLGIKNIENNSSRLFRDEFGKVTKLPNPVFSANELHSIRSKSIILVIIVISFTVAESFLYFLTASLFVPGAPEYMKILVAIFLAVLLMLALNYAFHRHFFYRIVIERYHKKEITEIEIRKHRDMRNIGYFIIIICFSAILFAGFSRIFFLENVPTAGLSDAKAESVTKASKMASIFTMLITIIAAIFMAVIKQDQAIYSVKHKIYKEWKNANIKRNIYTQNLIGHANSILLLVEKHAEKYWELVIDLKRVYHMETEYDSKYEELYKEFVELKASKNFILNEHVYRKFTVLQCSDELLFKYGIFNDETINAKINFCLEILKIPEVHIQDHLSAS